MLQYTYPAIHMSTFCQFNNVIKYTHLITVVIIKGDDGVSCASEISCSLSLSPVFLRSDLRSLQQI